MKQRRLVSLIIILSLCFLFSGCSSGRLIFHDDINNSYNTLNTNYNKPTFVTNLNLNNKEVINDTFTFTLTENQMPKIELSDYTSSQNNKNGTDFIPVFRFVVTSDIHIHETNRKQLSKFRDTISSAYKISRNDSNYNLLDAYVILGDIAEGGKQIQRDLVYEAIVDNLNLKQTLPILTMGNHDYYDGLFTAKNTEDLLERERLFNNTFRKISSGNKLENFSLVDRLNVQTSHYIIKGYHFIVVSPDDRGVDYSKNTVNWLQKQLEIAEKDTGKYVPIFVFRHIGSSNTVLGTDNETAFGGVDTLDEVLSKYSQIVDFSGHSHEPINNECSILQSDHTYIGSGTLNYSTSLNYNEKTIAYVDYNKYEISQYYIVEIDQFDRIRLRIYDENKDCFVGHEIILRGYTQADFTYTKEILDTKIIKFKNNAKANVISTTNNSAKIIFDVTDDNYFTATYFRLELTNIDTNQTEYYFLPWGYFVKNPSKKIEYNIDNLSSNTNYSLKIYGCNSMYSRTIKLTDKSSINYLNTEFSTN